MSRSAMLVSRTPPGRGPPLRRPGRWWPFALLLVLPVGRAADREVIRLGFTYSMFAGINDNDAKASLRALAAVIAQERGIAADPEPHLLAGADAVVSTVKAGVANSIGLTTEEYWRARRQVEFPSFLFNSPGDGEKYIVLTYPDSGINTLADLRGRNTLLLVGPRMSLALVWLDVELARLGAPPARTFLSGLAESSKPSKVVLPVFFRQVPACIVTRRTLATMIELNPQLARGTRVIAESPWYTPTLFAFTADIPPGFRERILQEFTALDRTPAGQQVLTIFQTSHVSAAPATLLDSALDLLERHAALGSPAAAAPTRPPPTSP